MREGKADVLPRYVALLESQAAQAIDTARHHYGMPPIRSGTATRPLDS
jgi:hypothetical protein